MLLMLASLISASIITLLDFKQNSSDVDTVINVSQPPTHANESCTISDLSLNENLTFLPPQLVSLDEWQSLMLESQDENYIKSIITGSISELDNSQIIKALYHPTSHAITYLKRSRVDDRTLREVRLRSLTDDLDTIIYSLYDSEPIDYISKQIQDITANGSNILAITTSESVFFYHFDSKLLEPIHHENLDLDGSLNVFAYRDAQLSSNGKYVLLTKGLYEGNDYLVKNLDTNELATTRGHYGTGNFIYDWYDDGLLMSTIGQHDDLFMYPAGLNILNPDLTLREHLDSQEWTHGYIDIQFLESGEFVYTESLPQESIQPCAGSDKLEKVAFKTRKVSRYDIETGQSKSLISIDETNSSKLDSEHLQLVAVRPVDVDEQRQLVLRIKRNGIIGQYLIIDSHTLQQIKTRE